MPTKTQKQFRRQMKSIQRGQKGSHAESRYDEVYGYRSSGYRRSGFRNKRVIWFGGGSAIIAIVIGLRLLWNAYALGSWGLFFYHKLHPDVTQTETQSPTGNTGGSSVGTPVGTPLKSRVTQPQMQVYDEIQKTDKAIVELNGIISLYTGTPQGLKNIPSTTFRNDLGTLEKLQTTNVMSTGASQPLVTWNRNIDAILMDIIQDDYNYRETSDVAYLSKRHQQVLQYNNLIHQETGVVTGMLTAVHIPFTALPNGSVEYQLP